MEKFGFATDNQSRVWVGSITDYHVFSNKTSGVNTRSTSEFEELLTVIRIGPPATVSSVVDIRRLV